MIRCRFSPLSICLCTASFLFFLWQCCSPPPHLRSVIDKGRTTPNDYFTTSDQRTLDFALRHRFYNDKRDGEDTLLMRDIQPANWRLAAWGSEDGNTAPLFKIKSMPIQIQKRQSPPRLSSFLSYNGPSQSSHINGWSLSTIPSPHVRDRPTLINLASMTSDAYYVTPSDPGWKNISLGFNHSSNFGWQTDGLRGHVFTTPSNDTAIIAFKGTSVDPRDKWSTNDRLNDNVLFSCCCASQRLDPYPYGHVCDCRTDTYRCNATCLSAEVARKDRYYATAVQVYQNVSRMYPGANIWTVGHSLGGAMASLIGLTFSVPAVSFESLPQRLPANRLGLSVPPDPRLSGGYHFGHTADPVFMGACNGISSSCAIAGYAFESQCFTGMRCTYDTVGDKGWRMSINTHRIDNVIPNVLEAYEEVAKCEADGECGECGNWYFDLDGKPKEGTESAARWDAEEDNK